MISDLECGDTSPLFKARTSPRTPKTLQKIDANKARPGVQKYFKKSEKKACQPLKNSIIRAKT